MLLSMSQSAEEAIIDRGKRGLIWIITSKVTIINLQINRNFYTRVKVVSQWSLSSLEAS